MAALGQTRTKLLFVRRTDRRHGPLAVFWGRTAERASRLSSVEIDRHAALAELDFTRPGPDAGHPLFLVCTHGKHDPCCARLGRPLYEALREQVDDGWAWQCTHVGGDRFAGNLVCLPHGLYFGRVDAAGCWSIVDEYLAGRIELDRYRGRSCYPFAVQAAERAVREATGARGVDDIELTAGDPIRFRVGGREYDVEVRREEGELTYATCGAERLTHPRRYAAGRLRERAP